MYQLTFVCIYSSHELMKDCALIGCHTLLLVDDMKACSPTSYIYSWFLDGIHGLVFHLHLALEQVVHVWKALVHLIVKSFSCISLSAWLYMSSVKVRSLSERLTQWWCQKYSVMLSPWVSQSARGSLGSYGAPRHKFPFCTGYRL